MDHYKNYLRLLKINKIIGGDIQDEHKELFYNKDSYMHYPLSWNLQNNQFSRWSIILKLIKLSPLQIQAIINNADDYNNFLNCVFVSITGFEDKLQKGYEIEYNKYLTKEYKHADIKTNTSKIMYVKDIINYFIDTHNRIKDLLSLSNEQDEDTAKNITNHLNLCRDFYYSWRKAINNFYGEPLFDGLIPRSTLEEKEKVKNEADRKKFPVNSLFKRLNANKSRIDTEYKKLYEVSVTTYLKIRCEGTPNIMGPGDTILVKADPTAYNHRYNVYLEPQDDLRKPRSMYLTGPDPNERYEYYGLQDNSHVYPRVPDDHPKLVIDKDTNIVKAVKKYDYGILYGPFTRIFTPNESNKEVADKCYEILEKFRENKPVFVLGYGASGAGKTSTLIAFKQGKTDDEKNGLLLQLLKSKDLNIYKEISVSVHELYSTRDDGSAERREYNDIIFEKVGDDFYLSQKNINGKTKEGSYTEIVRTPSDPVKLLEKEKEIKDLEKLYDAYRSNPSDLINGNIFLDAYNKFYFGNSPDFGPEYKYNKKEKDLPNTHFNSWSRDTEIQKLNDISWIKTEYFWQITNINNKVYFTGKDSKDKNLKSVDPKKEPELYNTFNSFSKIYDPRLLCRKDEKAEAIAIKENVPYKGECDEDDYKKEPVKINELGDFILTLVDRIRMINPTTNNIQSSRSHLLIYIKVPVLENGRVPENPTNYKYLIFGDLAGVENKFACETKDTQNQFLNLVLVDRVTGKQDLIKNEKHYTKNTKLKFIDLDPKDPQIKNITDYLGYNIREQKKGPNHLIRQFELEWASRYQSFFGSRMQEVKKHFNSISPESVDPKYKELVEYIKTKQLQEEDYFQGPKNKDGNFTDIPLANGVKLFSDYFKDVCVKNGLNLALFENGKIRDDTEERIIISTTQEFKDLVFNKDYRPSDGSKGFRSLGILNIIDSNEQMLKESGVKELCTERMNEGQFINNALIGMADNISQIVKRSNSTSDGGLFKNIPLVKGECFKHFCNQDHENCFVQIKHDVKGDSSILNDIKSVIDTDNYIQSNNLAIVVFAVLNINRKANDPPTMPYIDTNKLKNIRDDFLTYKFYNQDNIKVNDNKETIKQKFKKLIDLVFIGENGDPNFKEEAKPGSIISILNKFKAKMGETMYQSSIDAYKAIDPTKITFVTELINLIKALDIINSLSVIGTMNFLNELKNVYSTDNTCSIIQDSTDIIPKTNENITAYENIMTGLPLSVAINDQIDFSKTGVWKESNKTASYNEDKIRPALKDETYSTVTPTPVPKPSASVQKTPVPAQKAPVPAQKTPVPAQKAPVPAQKAPVPAQKTPVPAQKTPVPAQKTPVPAQSQKPIPFPFPVQLPKGWTTQTNGSTSWYVGPDGKATYTLTLPTGWSTNSDENDTWYIAPNGTQHWRPIWEPETWEFTKKENNGVEPTWSPPGKVAQQIANIENKVKKLDSIDSILGGYINDKSIMVNNKSELVSEYKQLKKMYKRMKNKII